MKDVKKILLLICLCAVIFSSLALNGCGEEKNGGDITIDVAELAKRIATEVSYDDSLYALEDYVVDMVYECGELSVKSSAYSGTGATAEAVAVFEAQSDEKADEIVAALQKYKLARSTEFDRYVPAEIEKIKSCVIKKVGRYVVFSVSPDSAAVESIIGSYGGEDAK